VTFGRRRQQLHLTDAMRELAADARASQQVSANLGYESVAGFITMFKKALEKPPAKYLNSVAQKHRFCIRRSWAVWRLRVALAVVRQPRC
jgi:AraC-like DNA-binding protein